MPSKNRRLALTIGDPNGIGPEIAVKAAAKLVSAGAEIVLVGDESIIADYKPGWMFRCHWTSPMRMRCHAMRFNPGVWIPGSVRQPLPISVRRSNSTLLAERTALSHVLIQRLRSLLGLRWARCRSHRYPQGDRMFLMLVAAGLSTVQVTSRESVQSALNRMSVDLVVAAARTAISALQRTDVDNPSIGVFGINPHASENGLFGDDDERITKPAVERFVGQGWRVLARSRLTSCSANAKEDLYVAMFHDQGYIPIKLLNPLEASALSIEAPVLFSSVAHGCAYDVAGRGIADSTGVEETLQLMASSYAR
jgi:4-hydroxy-L-threonine phosphate dehydrogenase PdxA